MTCENCENLQLQVDKIREAVIGNGKLIISVIKRNEIRKSLQSAKDQYERLKELKQFGQKFSDFDQKEFDELKALVVEYNL